MTWRRKQLPDHPRPHRRSRGARDQQQSEGCRRASPPASVCRCGGAPPAPGPRSGSEGRRARPPTLCPPQRRAGRRANATTSPDAPPLAHLSDNHPPDTVGDGEDHDGDRDADSIEQDEHRKDHTEKGQECDSIEGGGGKQTFIRQENEGHMGDGFAFSPIGVLMPGITLSPDSITSRGGSIDLST